MDPQIDAHNSTFNHVRGHQINLRNSSNISIEIHPTSTWSRSDSGVAVVKGPGYVARLRKFDRCDIELTTSVDGIMVPDDSIVHRGLSWGTLLQDNSRVLVKFYPSLSEENFVEEVKHMSKFDRAYIAHLRGISKLDSPSQFVVLSDPTIVTYKQYTSTLQGLGKEYRDFDKKYEMSFSFAFKYLKNEIDGLALECIFTDVRAVQRSGEAWIIVPPPVENDHERAKLSTVMFDKAGKMLQRRLTVAKKIVRCSNCLPSTLEWYRSLATVMQRVLENVPQVQDPNSSEYNTQHLIVEMLQHAEPQLVEAAESVISRSINVPSGLCGWCGERWGPTGGAAQVAGVRRNSRILVIAIAVAVIAALGMIIKTHLKT